jgi:hypothetical protein
VPPSACSRDWLRASNVCTTIYSAITVGDCAHSECSQFLGRTLTARLVASARLPSAPMMSASMCSNQHFLAATMPSCARSSPAPIKHCMNSWWLITVRVRYGVSCRHTSAGTGRSRPPARQDGCLITMCSVCIGIHPVQQLCEAGTQHLRRSTLLTGGSRKFEQMQGRLRASGSGQVCCARPLLGHPTHLQRWPRACRAFHRKLQPAMIRAIWKRRRYLNLQMHSQN